MATQQAAIANQHDTIADPLAVTHCGPHVVHSLPRCVAAFGRNREDANYPRPTADIPHPTKADLAIHGHLRRYWNCAQRLLTRRDESAT